MARHVLLLNERLWGREDQCIRPGFGPTKTTRPPHTVKTTHPTPVIACNFHFSLTLDIFHGLAFSKCVQYHSVNFSASSAIQLALVVQGANTAIHEINHYPVDKSSQDKPRYSLDSDLSGGWHYPSFEQLAPLLK